MATDFAGKEVLLTGYGFVGSYIVSRLRAEGAHVKILARDLRKVEKLPKSVELVLHDARYLDQDMEVDYVFHLSGVTNIPYAQANRNETYEQNVLATENMLKHVKAREKFLFTSAASVYGTPTNGQAIKEDTPHSPQSYYAETKSKAEEVVRKFGKERGQKYIITRFFNLYGPGQPPFYLIPMITLEGLQKHTITLREGSAVRDFLYVEDAVDCMMKIMLSPDIVNQEVNIGSGVGRKVIDIARVVADALGDPKLKIIDQNLNSPIDSRFLVADITRARSSGWEPKTDLRAGVAHTVEYYKEFAKQIQKE